jgi:hypothetical protein
MDDLGPKMLALNERERAFVCAYLANAGNAKQAAITAGYSDLGDAAKVRGHHLLHRPKILDALDEVGKKTFRGLLAPCLAAAKAIIERPDHPDHSKMVIALLSRLGYHERATVDVNISGSVELNPTDRAVEDLKIMLDLGVPEDKLLETFGYSGLGRYKKMVAEKYGKGLKLIETKPEPPGAIVDKPTAIG